MGLEMWKNGKKILTTKEAVALTTDEVAKAVKGGAILKKVKVGK